MLIKSLDGHWKTTYVPYDWPIDDILSSQYVPEGWLDAEIPEDIHATLRRAGLIRGHYMGRDVDEDKWIEDADWVYYKEFYVGGEFQKTKVTLAFEGLDTLCDIYLNGAHIGSGKNMFVGMAFDVTTSIRYGARNVLIVRFHSPVKSVQSLCRDGLFSTNTYERLHLRKAQMNFGWDFCGRYVTAGIWKSVCLKAYDHNRIERWYFYTLDAEAASATACLALDVTDDIDTPDIYTVSIGLMDGDRPVYYAEGRIRELSSVLMGVDNPKLWWPRPYGEPYLYNLQVVLYREGVPVDRIFQKVGIRTVYVIQQQQNDGTSFLFEVNGRKIFARGANWVPLDVMYTDIAPQDYEKTLYYAVQGNISMLRVWGGGIYEYDCFYDLCDRYGILVVQDFMLACGVYPQSGEFLENMRDEARYNILKLRNRACIAAWCGDNENDLSYGWDMRQYAFAGDKLNRDVLMDTCERLDPHRFYLPSSPCSPNENYTGGDNPNSPYQGDMHLYLFSMFPENSNYYGKVRNIRPRFVSEFGFLSFPERDTYGRFNFFRQETNMIEPSIADYPHPDSYARFGSKQDCILYYSGVYHSHCLKDWIEYFRSLKGTCWGCLYWKFNDALADNNDDGHNQFPSLMSVIDFYQKPKMAYYYARRAYEDVIIACINEDGGGYSVYVCSELSFNLSGVLEIRHMDFSGRTLWSESVETAVEKDSVSRLYTISTDQLTIANKYGEYINVAFVTDSLRIENRYFFVDVGEYYKLEFVPSNMKLVDSQLDGEEIVMKICSENFARNVGFNIPDHEAFFSDNYFDMDARTEKTIHIHMRDTDSTFGKRIYFEAENQERITLDIAELIREV